VARCRVCGEVISWGFDGVSGRYIPLEPRETDTDLEKTFVDEDGELRADHRDRHEDGTVINVERLRRRVQPPESEPRKRWRPRAKA
jgi:hypothetical protein